MPEWFADDAFWADVFPFEFGEAAFAAGDTQVEQAIALSGVARGDVLDLGCGPGRHALVMELGSKERIAKVIQPTLSQRLPDGTLRVQRHEIVDDGTRVENEWLFIEGGRIRTYEFTLRIYSGQELKTALGAAGFGRVTLYGALDGRPYGAEAERLVAVATT